MPRLFMALHQEDRFPILDILAQTPAIPETCQWCMFLRNHDELTLEMVTDEERDYMYRAYANDHQARINLGIRRRLAPLLNNDRRRIELMNALLFALPGTPVVYYGDEIGMGANIFLGHRNGVRKTMQCSDRNAGFSRCNPQRLYLPVSIDPEYHYEAINVEAQQNNPSSLLWWMKRLIALRKKYKAFGRGTLDMLPSRDSKILAFVRRYDDEHILVVANLSRFVQHVELNLSEYRGMVPQEMFSRGMFPAIADRPYPLTLAPHGFYWFALVPGQVGALALATTTGSEELPFLGEVTRWEALFESRNKQRIEALLPEFLARRRMEHGGGPIRAATMEEMLGGAVEGVDAQQFIVRVEYESGEVESMLLPLARVPEDQVGKLLEPIAVAGLIRVSGSPPAVLCDALTVPAYGAEVLRMIAARTRTPFGDGVLLSLALPAFTEVCGPAWRDLPPMPNLGERTNPSVLFGDRAVLKAFRRLARVSTRTWR
jgi:maltose alpha-D-glucosyltransferase/alpha-amylase